VGGNKYDLIETADLGDNNGTSCFFETTALFFVSFFLTSLSTMLRRLVRFFIDESSAITTQKFFLLKLPHLEEMIREGVGEGTEKEYPTQNLNEICIKFTS